MDDIRAVMDAEGVERAALLAAHEATRLAVLFAASYPERTAGLVLHEPSVRGRRTPRLPVGANRRAVAGVAARRERALGRGRVLPGDAPRVLALGRGRPRVRPLVRPPHALERESERGCGLPADGDGGRRLEHPRRRARADARDASPDVARGRGVRGRAGSAAPSASRSPASSTATRGRTPTPTRSCSMRRHASCRAWTGRPIRTASSPRSCSRTSSGSTDRAAALGDVRWRDLLERHHAIVRRRLAEFRGEEMGTAGDGFFAMFDGPARAIRSARAIRDDVRALGLEVRAGLHTGEGPSDRRAGRRHRRPHRRPRRRPGGCERGARLARRSGIWSPDRRSRSRIAVDTPSRACPVNGSCTRSSDGRRASGGLLRAPAPRAEPRCASHLLPVP